MAKTDMTPEEIAAFLGEFQFAAVATQRKDGSPFITPLGYTTDGEFVYLSVASSRSFISRVKRDPRMCICVFNNEYPARAVILQGQAEIVEDPGDRISREICRRYMQAAPGVEDFEAYERKWLAPGRAVFRMPIDRPITWDLGKLNPYAVVAGIARKQAKTS